MTCLRWIYRQGKCECRGRAPGRSRPVPSRRSPAAPVGPPGRLRVDAPVGVGGHRHGLPRGLPRVDLGGVDREPDGGVGVRTGPARGVRRSAGPSGSCRRCRRTGRCTRPGRSPRGCGTRRPPWCACDAHSRAVSTSRSIPVLRAKAVARALDVPDGGVGDAASMWSAAARPASSRVRDAVGRPPGECRAAQVRLAGAVAGLLQGGWRHSSAWWVISGRSAVMVCRVGVARCGDPGRC